MSHSWQEGHRQEIRLYEFYWEKKWQATSGICQENKIDILNQFILEEISNKLLEKCKKQVWSVIVSIIGWIKAEKDI